MIRPDRVMAKDTTDRTAGRFLQNLMRSNLASFLITFGLLALENALFLAYPLFGGFAINAILKGDVLAASGYALMVLGFWSVGALRRAVDTRVFSRVYAHLAADVAQEQHARGHKPSRVVARVDLAREFVDFFEAHLPMLATSVISIFGAVGMLMVLDMWLGLACSVALLFVLIAFPAFSRRNEKLHNRFNNQLERGVDILSTGRRPRILRHFNLLSDLRVRLSDLEAWAYLALGVIAALLFLTAIIGLSRSGQTDAGRIYAVMTYLWTFVMSLDEAPRLADHIAKLRNIAQRLGQAG
ncbi:MAG: ABC transporter six-transmembrane domain-containing protein [Asticcacaulis sp.]|uniref:ABC transporter six-transmembrane domain-containing protein n=1 Tax=Asticcacaulis sp. TaxID=1872648 RepID=UPI0025BCC18F|nr:ABC transporter six-transmembrane domain-containing protein [Asticcacaulis sp.]MCA1936520.1 ABC transporter six-transmembrane domain-containing protein [Asticcacaulis sp.]